MAWLPLLASWIAILGAAGLRYRRVGLHHAAPLPLSPPLWIALLVISLVTAGFLLRRRGRRFPSDPTARQAAWELSIFPLLFLLVWTWFPSGPRQPNHLAVAGGVIATVAFLLRRDPGWRALWGSMHAFCEAARSLSIPTLLLMVPVLILFRLDPVPVSGARFAKSLLRYPLYAFVQLALVLVFSQSRLRRLGASSAALVLVPAGLFALVHWPNLPLMITTFVAMLVWALVYQRHPSLPAVALSMGILATVATQLLPEDLTAHLRAGPGYVLHEYLDEVYAEQARLEAGCVTDDFYREAGGSVPDYARALFAAILEGRAPPAELDRFARTWQLKWYARVAAQFEFARRARDGLAPDEAACTRRGQDLAATWFEGRKRSAEDSGGWTDYVPMLYRAVLDREGSAEEIASWNALPPVGFRRAMIHAAFEEPAFFERPGTAAWCLQRLEPLIPPHKVPLPAER